MALARAHLALDAAERAGELLDPLLAPALPYRIEAVHARVRWAQAQLAQGRTAASLEALAEAVNLAQYEGVIGPFVTAGGSISPLLQRLRDIGGLHPGFTRDLLGALESAAGWELPGTVRIERRPPLANTAAERGRWPYSREERREEMRDGRCHRIPGAGTRGTITRTPRLGRPFRGPADGITFSAAVTGSGPTTVARGRRQGAARRASPPTPDPGPGR